MTHEDPKITDLYNWLVSGAPGARTPMDVVAHICTALIEAGIPIARAEALVRTLHPYIAGRSFVWESGQPVAVQEITWAYLNSPAYLDSPTALVCKSGLPQRSRSTPGFTDLWVGPLKFLSGDTHAFTFASRAPGGFTDEQVAVLARILVPLSRVAEIFALYRTAANLLNTYVGHGAGEKILAGKIQRGDTDTIHAVIWFSDLRGFTSLSTLLPPEGIIRVLNDLFECQVPAIEKHGGEVLKFMGDGLLAIFPVSSAGGNEKECCDRALRAAQDAQQALMQLNQRRTATHAVPIQFGLALHIGQVAYGNIGGSNRLDFTCIGPSVNLASRLEGLTGKLSKSVVFSQDFAHLTSQAVREIGQFELKGVRGAVGVYELA